MSSTRNAILRMSSFLCFFCFFLCVLQVRTLTESVREDSELARDTLIKTSGDGNDSSSSSADGEDDVEVTSPRLSTATEGIHDVREYPASLQGVRQEVRVALSRIDAFILS